MKGHKRNIFPGGNTPYGFHSYYNYIMPQNKAEKIFCLKGGPGTGKSTIMKEIGEYFIDNGEDVDFLWCSSDPDSLDGVVIKNRNAAVVDGTAPHIVDPENPGAVDRITDLGAYWDESLLRASRESILRCNKETGDCFRLAYGYLRCAGGYHSFLTDITDSMVRDTDKYDMRMQLDLALDNISSIKRAETKSRNDHVMGRIHRSGNKKRFFADAITPAGVRSGLESLTENIGRLVIIRSKTGFDTGDLIRSADERLRRAGFDTEVYYCPMEPLTHPEHVISQKADVAVITENEYHSLPSGCVHSRKTRVIEIMTDDSVKKISDDMMIDLRVRMLENINKAVKMLSDAKAHHDELEGYYIPAMDFSKVRTAGREIIEEIEKHCGIRQ